MIQAITRWDGWIDRLIKNWNKIVYLFKISDQMIVVITDIIYSLIYHLKNILFGSPCR